MRENNDRKSVGMLVLSMVIFGTIGVFRRHILLPSAFIACARGILGGLVLLVAVKWKGKNVTEGLSRRTIFLLVITGALMGINWILLFEAYDHTTVAVATLCYYMQPTIVLLAMPIIFKDRLTVKQSVCALVSIIGMVLVSGVIGGSDPGKEHFHGILLGLCAAVFYAAVVIMNKRISGIDPYSKTVIQLLSAGGVMIPYLLLTGEFVVADPGEISWLLLFVVGVIHTGIAYMLYFGSMDGVMTQSVALLSYIDPVSALLFAGLFLKEPLGVSGVIGAIMIIGSAVIGSSGENRPMRRMKNGEPEGG